MKYLKKRKKIIIASVVSILTAATIIGSIFTVRTYDNAVALVKEGAYEEAASEFEKIIPTKIYIIVGFFRDFFVSWDDDIRNIVDEYDDHNAKVIAYKDSIPLYFYASARSIYNSEGLDPYADIYLDNISEYYDGDLSEEVTAFKKDYERQLHETISTIVKREMQQEEEKKLSLKSKVPYVGLEEKYIAETSLGKPSPTVEREVEKYDYTKKRTVKTYTFKSGNAIIFKAKVVDEEVTEVWDYRENPIRKKYIPSISNSSSSSGKKSDPYNAKDYSDAEDFYDDYSDEFYDYEEAEEYYEEHGSW